MGVKNAPPETVRLGWAREKATPGPGRSCRQAVRVACGITMIVTHETLKRLNPCIARIWVTIRMRGGYPLCCFAGAAFDGSFSHRKDATIFSNTGSYFLTVSGFMVKVSS